MHSSLSTATTDSQLGTPTATTQATEWLPTLNRLACVAFLTATFIYYDGIPGVSYEVASAILVGAWCVGLRSVIRRFIPAPQVSAAAAATIADAVVPDISGHATDAVRNELRDAARPASGRVVPIATGSRREREDDTSRMRPAV